MVDTVNVRINLLDFLQGPRMADAQLSLNNAVQGLITRIVYYVEHEKLISRIFAAAGTSNSVGLHRKL